MTVTLPDIKKAYRFLKSYIYHENMILFLKFKLAEFENDNIEKNDFEKYFKKIEQVITDYAKNKNNQQFTTWLSQIDYQLLAKAVDRPEDKRTEHDGIFISNEKTSKNKQYKTDKVNYFINSPIELHIIEMLWALNVGALLDKELSEHCYANRIYQKNLVFSKNTVHSKNNSAYAIFKPYHAQYNAWRNNAIECAKKLAKAGQNVAIFSLDLQSFFYCIETDFSVIRNKIHTSAQEIEEISAALTLTNMLEEMHLHYHKKIQPSLKITHPHAEKKQGLPIGFLSSSILANCYLNDFDQKITDQVRPDYYGRYVDDMLFVFKQPIINPENPILDFVTRYFKDLLIPEEQDTTTFTLQHEYGNLTIQREKFILHFFAKGQSLASLELFKKELDERSSAFRFLPDEQIEADLDHYAYDILYEGSPNKLRSIVGLSENETKLSHYLAAHITAHRLCKIDKKDRINPKLDSFFYGVNRLKFSRLWERVYQYATITEQQSFAEKFYTAVNTEINQLNYFSNADQINTDISTKIKDDLHLYNRISYALCLGLLGSAEEIIKKTVKKKDTTIINDTTMIRMACTLRQANLIRHHLVAWPLTNFTGYSGNLTCEQSIADGKQKELAIHYSPRFIHFDEWQLFQLHYEINMRENTTLTNWQKITKYKEIDSNSSIFNHIKEESKTLFIKDAIKKEALLIAVANLHVKKEDTQNAVRKDQKPNVSLARQTQLYELLNAAIRDKKDAIDLLVLPEVSIPVSWLPFMITFARKHQLGIIFGLEHWIANGLAYNLLIEALPFKANQYNSCLMTARLKTHYAPVEISMLQAYNLKSPATGENNYQVISWRGVSLVSYNCYELADIEHRALFKSKVDLLIACVWNPDINYYANILESAVRDIHCYVIHANTAQYGGSCILQPTKTETKTLLYVKGGLNACLLTEKIDIAKLRAFQFNRNNQKDLKDPTDSFKPLPPGFNHEGLAKRSNS